MSELDKLAQEGKSTEVDAKFLLDLIYRKAELEKLLNAAEKKRDLLEQDRIAFCARWGEEFYRLCVEAGRKELAEKEAKR